MAADNLGMLTIKSHETRIRELCPQAYALTANEAMRLKRIDFAIFQFFDAHREFIGVSREAERDADTGEYIRPAAYHYIYNDESIALLRSTFKSKRISLDNAAKLADRVLSHKLFAVDNIVSIDDNEIEVETYALYVKDGYVGQLERAVYPEFYKVWDEYRDSNAEALRLALRLEAGYLYITTYEINILRIIKHISEYTSQPFTAPMQSGYIAIKATRESTALAAIGRAALNAATYDEINEAHNLTAAIGTEIRLRGKLIGKRAFVSVDKLQRQLLDKACKSGFTSSEIELSLDEFMQLRQLTDKKSAREQFKRAADDYYEVSYEAVSDTGRVRIRPLDAQAILNYGKAVFSFSSKFFDAHKRNGSLEYIPEAYFALSGNNDVNTYSVGIYIYDYTRRNLGKPNENKIKVTTLLEVTSLPSAAEIDSKYYKRQIIEPFFKALSKAATLGGFKYSLALSGGKPLSDRDSVNAHYDYDLFSDCVIVIQWIKEPEYHSQLRERKQAEAERKRLAEGAKVERDRATVEAADKRKRGRKRKVEPVKSE